MRYSESTDKLFSALSAFQGEVTNPKAEANNPFFKSKYAKLDDILALVRPLLSKHGLAVVQMPCSCDGAVGVVTLVSHSSGQYVEGDPYYLKLSKQDAQAGGSAITYARRYALAAALGVAQDDDDGNGASGNDKAYQCAVCGKPVEKDFAEKSIEANGKVYCSGTCKAKANGDAA